MTALVNDDASYTLPGTLSTNSTLVPKSEWRSLIRPVVQTVRSQLQNLQDLSDRDRSLIIERISSSHSKNFRQRFLMMIEALNLDSIKPFVSGIIATRNSLIHSGRFSSDDGQYNYKQYVAMLWAAWCVLLRLAGYTGSVPCPSVLIHQMPMEERRWLRARDYEVETEDSSDT